MARYVRLTREGGWRSVLRKDGVEIGNSGLGRVEERDRKFLMSFAQKLATKRNGRKSIAA